MALRHRRAKQEWIELTYSRVVRVLIAVKRYPIADIGWPARSAKSVICLPMSRTMERDFVPARSSTLGWKAIYM